MRSTSHILPVAQVTVALAICCLPLNAIAVENVALKLAVTPTADARQVSLAGPIGSTRLLSAFDEDPTIVSVEASAINAKPSDVVVTWADGSKSSFPLYPLPQFVGQGEIELWFFGQRVGPTNQKDADSLCRDTSLDDFETAFRLVFGCSQWVTALERKYESDPWTKAYLRALNGWMRGNNWLALRGLQVNGTVVSPYGYHEELVMRLKKLLTKYQAVGRDASRFSPISVDEVRRIIREHDQQPIAVASTIGRLLADGQFDLAKQIYNHAYAAYQQSVVAQGEPSVYSVDAKWFEGNAQMLEQFAGQ